MHLWASGSQFSNLRDGPEPLAFEHLHAEIRRLKIELAHSRNGALRYAFYKTSSNGHTPTFTAVSYCWGQAEHDHVIYLGSTVVNVTKAVNNVLRGVLANRAALVWIDQVCID